MADGTAGQAVYRGFPSSTMILTTFTALTYPIVIQYKRGRWWSLLAPLAAFVLFVDIIANYLEWSIVFGWPQRSDHTITARTKSMLDDKLESRRKLAQLIQIYLDACEPDGKH